MTDELLFVYGTLRRGVAGTMARLLGRHAEFVAEARFQGRLFLVRDYPGVVSSDDPAAQVKGDVYRLREPGSLLQRLDAYEECGPGFPAPTEYVREARQVLLADGSRRSAWVYLYNRPVDGLSLIPSGDFLAGRG